jgi:hypothetical protein
VKTFRLMSFAALGAGFLLAACGGTDDSEFQKNAPTYDLVHLEMDSTDATPPDTSTALTQALDTDPCHPHLFARTHEVVRRLNWHIERVVHHVAEIVARHSEAQTGTSRVWENVKDGVDRRFTMSKGADGSWSFQLELATASATPDFHTAFQGTLVPTMASSADGGSTLDEVTGDVTFDYDAVKAVYPLARASGQLAFHYDVVRQPVRSREIVVTFTNFLPEDGDPHGPRNGSYVFYGKPGVGGSLKFEDSLVLLCPSNPNGEVADVDVVAEWFHGADGNVYGRADALAFGGQIPAGEDWQGVTCHDGSRVSADSETYWMMKLENAADGSTIQGSAVQSSTSAPTQCDPAFVNGDSVTPTLDGPANDFPFSSYFNADGSLKDSTPFVFPAIG